MHICVASYPALTFTWMAEHHLKAAELGVVIDSEEVYLAIKALCDVDEGLPKSQKRLEEAQSRVNALLKQQSNALCVVERNKQRQEAKGASSIMR